jgi:hypothetical protein
VIILDEKEKGNKYRRKRDYEMIVSEDREDLIKLNEIVTKNTEDLEMMLYEESYEKAEEFLKKTKLVNPNRFFWSGNGISDEIDGEEFIPILQILKKDPRFRAKDLISVALTERLRPSQIIFDEVGSLWKWQDILDSLFEKINYGEYISDPVLFVEAAVRNGARKENIKRYISSMKLFNEYQDPDEFGYQQRTLYEIRQYLKTI